MPDWYGFSLDAPDYKTYDGWKAMLTRPQTLQWKFNVHRLHFYFQDTSGNEIPDATLWTQLDNCLRAISESGAKAVLDLHNWGAATGYVNVLVGSTIWFRKWLALVDHFKNDSRVIAWELYNEPDSIYLDPYYGGDGTNIHSSEKIEGLMKAQYDLSVQIRAIDPNRTIVWAAYYNNGTAHFTPLDSPTSHTDYTKLIHNIVLSYHPYDYGTCTSWTADANPTCAGGLEAIWNYRQSLITLFSTAYPVWLGEIECHSPSDGGASTISLEEQYVATVLNYAFANHLGFAIWKYPAMDLSGSDADRVIFQSGYVPPSPPFPTIPVVLAALVGLGLGYWLLRR